jgi:hypothetical protein
MINQQILKLYLHLLAYHCNITFLDPGFFPALRDQGCSAVKSWFALQNRRRSPRSDSRPHLTGESVIAIPCFVHDCHWVAVTRREVAGRILFLYADDLNSPTTEASVRQMFSMCGKDFFPDSAVWVTCKNYTYSPHSNECGARTLPALKIQALHPNPHSTILIPSMHQYIAQISRTWVAMTLTQNQFLYTLLDKVMSHSPIEEMNLHGPWTLPTAPATLIGWTALSSESSAPEIPCTDSSTKFPQGGTLTIPKSSANPPPNSPQTDHHYLRPSIVASNRHSPICMSTAQPLNPCAPSFVPMETCESPVTGRPTENLLGFSHSPLLPVSNLNPQAPAFLPLRHPATGKSLAPIHNSNASVTQHNHKEPRPSSQRQQEVSTKPIKAGRSLPPLPQQPTLHKFFSCQHKASTLSYHNAENTWGHTMEEIESSSVFRAYGIGAFSIIETKLNCAQQSSLPGIKRCFRRTWQHSDFQASQSEYFFTGYHQPGGTLTSLMDRWSSRRQSKGVDPIGLGRWSYITLRGKTDTIITLIPAYRVSQKSPGAVGPKTAYMQQYCTLLEKWNKLGVSAKVEPNRQFIIDPRRG